MEKRTMLILGDVITLAVITVVGFASHSELQSGSLPRMLATFIPLLVSWFLVAPWLTLFNPDINSDLKHIWRVPLAAILAAPMMGILRAAVLGAAALPLFVLVISVSTAVGMLVWRIGWNFFFSEKQTR